MLSESLQKYPRVFNSLFVNMIKAGEKSGALGEVLNNILEYREKEHDIHQKVQAALAYPLLTAAVGVITVFIMLTFFMPKLIGMFEGMHRKLPLSTKILIDLSSFMSAHWYWFVMIFVIALLIFGRVKEGSKKKAVLDYVKLRLPIINKFVKDAEVAKFSRTLSLLLKNGVSIYSSLEMAIDVLDIDIYDQLKKHSIDTEAVNVLIDQKYELKKATAIQAVGALAQLKSSLSEEQYEALKNLKESESKEKSEHHR